MNIYIVLEDPEKRLIKSICISKMLAHKICTVLSSPERKLFIEAYEIYDTEILEGFLARPKPPENECDD